MTVFNLGSINIDHFYELSHLPVPGETLAAGGYSKGLGGKGANQSVAAVRAGAPVRHIGAVGSDGDAILAQLSGFGVNTGHISRVDTATGHAIVMVDAEGENTILIHPGANQQISKSSITEALKTASDADWLLIQNETNNQHFAAEQGRKLGLRVAYVAAPFDADATMSILPHVDVLILNAVEMKQLQQCANGAMEALGVETIIVTQGAEGGHVFQAANAWQLERFLAPKVDAVDTTGAGDTFTGYLLAGLDTGLGLWPSIERATCAAALHVTKKGTAAAIPSLSEVNAFGGQ